MIKKFWLKSMRSIFELSRKPSYVELPAFFSSVVRIISLRPLVPDSVDPNNFTRITQASLLISIFGHFNPELDPQSKDLFAVGILIFAKLAG